MSDDGRSLYTAKERIEFGSKVQSRCILRNGKVDWSALATFATEINVNKTTLYGWYNRYKENNNTEVKTKEESNSAHLHIAAAQTQRTIKEIDKLKIEIDTLKSAIKALTKEKEMLENLVEYYYQKNRSNK
jgi:transposase-like protein